MNKIEIKLYAFNVKQFNVTVFIYGYLNVTNLPIDFMPILYFVPNDYGYQRFGIGRRQQLDENLFNLSQSSNNLSIEFLIDRKEFITYVNFSVNVSV